ncbi:MAG TPA: MmcQ/YjbR family DNA-binding protein [Saprospiraceae bacterium]|nr:MmcQ/YjbR family DNA-binding protein [Saprospiraceae bacterium]
MIDIEVVRSYCLSLPHATEDLPFGPDTLVFRIGGKIFGLMGLDAVDFYSINLKCDPDQVEELRANYNYVIPGYHMNKKHWNTVQLTDESDFKVVKKLIDDSYKLVKNSLPKNIKNTLI